MSVTCENILVTYLAISSELAEVCMNSITWLHGCIACVGQEDVSIIITGCSKQFANEYRKLHHSEHAIFSCYTLIFIRTSKFWPSLIVLNFLHNLYSQEQQQYEITPKILQIHAFLYKTSKCWMRLIVFKFWIIIRLKLFLKLFLFPSCQLYLHF